MNMKRFEKWMEKQLVVLPSPHRPPSSGSPGNSVGPEAEIHTQDLQERWDKYSRWGGMTAQNSTGVLEKI